MVNCTLEITSPGFVFYSISEEPCHLDDTKVKPVRKVHDRKEIRAVLRRAKNTQKDRRLGEERTKKNINNFIQMLTSIGNQHRPTLPKNPSRDVQIQTAEETVKKWHTNAEQNGGKNVIDAAVFRIATDSFENQKKKET